MNCSNIAEYKDYVWYRVSLAYSIVIALATIVITYAYLWKFSEHILFHRNFKIMLKLYLWSFIVRSFASLIFWARGLYIYTFNEPCTILFDQMECWATRHPVLAIIIFMSAIQFSIMIERCVAACNHRNYENYSSWLGIGLSISAIVFSELLALRLQWVFPIEGTASVCLRKYYMIQWGAFDGGDILLVVCVLLDSVSLLVIFLLHCICRKRQKDKIYRSISPAGQLSNKFEYKSQDKILGGLLPTFIFHSLATLAQWGIQFYLTLRKNDFSEVQYKTFTLFGNIGILYMMLAPLLLWFTSNRRKSSVSPMKDNAGDEYFKMYSSMW